MGALVFLSLNDHYFEKKGVIMPEMLWFRVCVYYVSFYTIILLILRAFLEAVHDLFILHPRLNEISNF